MVRALQNRLPFRLHNSLIPSAAEHAIVPFPIELFLVWEGRGWKDTIACPLGQMTRIFTLFVEKTGRFVWHRRMLEHEDHEMMRPYLLRA
jgi:hypothetical protein